MKNKTNEQYCLEKPNWSVQETERQLKTNKLQEGKIKHGTPTNEEPSHQLGRHRTTAGPMKGRQKTNKKRGPHHNEKTVQTRKKGKQREGGGAEN